jgi:hypothetical protein
VLARHTGANGEDQYQFWEAVWAGSDMVFSHSPLRIERQSNIWMQKLASAMI